MKLMMLTKQFISALEMFLALTAAVVEAIYKEPLCTCKMTDVEPKRPIGAVETFHKAIQIIIGLIHIGFGGVESVISLGYYFSVATIGGYPFWGGLFFIISGSLSVSSEKNAGAMKCSVGFNIVSAIFALVGIILYVSELAINASYSQGSYEGYHAVCIGTGLSALLLLFSLLEFSITVSTAHFGCQMYCCKDDPEISVFVPYMVTGVGAVPAEGNPSPPSYDNIAFSPAREAS
ncbi:membrane-spanning 4-domains subfamily A member 8-like [Tiliqua scincoides]|uniref:membrane-spanning 4-domains subfamily A member 8-like n=1 Tax=Tiliqua scincoides TaxID=71010 RepID=UPI003462FAF2